MDPKDESERGDSQPYLIMSASQRMSWQGGGEEGSCLKLETREAGQEQKDEFSLGDTRF